LTNELTVDSVTVYLCLRRRSADAVQVHEDENTLCWATWRSGALTDTELEKFLELAQGFNEQTAKGAF